MELISKKQKLAGLIGSYLLPLFPKKSNKLKNQDFTLAHANNNYSFLDNILRLGLLHNIIKTDNTTELADYHQKFWQSDAATAYHEKTLSEDAILPAFAHITDDIDNIITTSGYEFSTLCEIGSGSGQLLNHLSKSITRVDQFIGIDLSQDTADACNQRYPEDNIQFVAGDAKEWIKNNGQSHWVYVSYRGVLEYFPQDTLLAFLSDTKQACKPCIFVIVEPLGINHDLENSTQSEPYSAEFSFSHHYEHLFSSAGFDIHSIQIEPYLPNAKLICLVASSGIKSDNTAT
ncbi:MAG: class I SAM-dependent methyltransferase [Cellvibrionaceae bacterium]